MIDQPPSAGRAPAPEPPPEDPRAHLRDCEVENCDVCDFIERAIHPTTPLAPVAALRVGPPQAESQAFNFAWRHDFAERMERFGRLLVKGAFSQNDIIYKQLCEWAAEIRLPSAGVPPPAAALDDHFDEALTALSFAEGAIIDAIGLEDGLDGGAGEKVLKMIRAALIANGREPITIPPQDEPGDPPYQTTEQRLEASGLGALIADFEAAIAEPGGRQRGTCWTCGVDHENEQRLNRAVIALTLRRLKKLRLSPPPAAETPTVGETVRMRINHSERGLAAGYVREYVEMVNQTIGELRDSAEWKRANGYHQPKGDKLLTEERAANLLEQLRAVPPPADETGQPILSKATDDGNFSVTIHAKIQADDTLVSGDTLLRLSKLLTEAADGILRNHPLPSAPAKDTK